MKIQIRLVFGSPQGTLIVVYKLEPNLPIPNIKANNEVLAPPTIAMVNNNNNTEIIKYCC